MSEADKPDDNALVVRGADGDPLPHPGGTRMIEKESYERVIEGLKMAADACMHLRRHEPNHGQTWTDIGLLLDKMRRDASALAGLELTMKQNETPEARGLPYGWRQARARFLEGIRQATGGMRQLATCFRGDLHWSVLAQQLERSERSFRDLLLGRRQILAPTAALAAKIQKTAAAVPKLILPPGYVRH